MSTVRGVLGVSLAVVIFVRSPTSEDAAPPAAPTPLFASGQCRPVLSSMTTTLIYVP